MSVGEQGAAFGKGVDMGRLYLRMSAHAAEPIILVVDGNEEDIWFAFALHDGRH